jgi:type II secretory pathway pseudopilin PulG
VRFAPPRSAEALAGPTPFGVRVRSREDPAGSVVEEGVVDIGAFSQVTVELVPRRSRGPRKGRHEIAVDNTGNQPSTVEVTAADPDDMLRFRLDQSVLVVQPGTAAFVRLLVVPKDRFLRGAERMHPFQVLVNDGTGPPITADGTMAQRQVLPKWLLPALLALIALAIAAVVLWFTVLKPVVNSAVREAVQEETAQQAAQASQAAQAAQAAQAQAAQADKKADAANKALGIDPNGDQTAPPNAPGNPPPAPTSSAVDFRIAANAAPAGGGSNFAEFRADPALPADKTLVISDLVLQNPRGDSGILRIVRLNGSTRTTLLEVGLNNFRDLDYHFVQPWRFPPGEQVLLTVNCQNPVDRCQPAASFSGQLQG